MARERKGTIYPGPKGELWVKFTVDILDPEGKPVLDEKGKPKVKRIPYNLHTFDRRLATVKRSALFKQLQEQGELPKAVVKETMKASLLFRDAAKSVLDASKISDIKSQRHRIETWAYPILGKLRVDQITMSKQFTEVLEKCNKDKKSRQTIVHLKWDMSKLWKAFVYEGWVAPEFELLASKAKIPEDCFVDSRTRAVLTDDELQGYLRWQHELPKYHSHVLERQVMCAMARMFAGCRTSEVLRLRWQDFTMVDGEFIQGWVTRSKTDDSQVHGLIPMVRPILKLWWEKSGKPFEGVLFPKRKGQGAGSEKRGKASFANALRRDLARAWGLERWNEGTLRYEADPDAQPTRRQVQVLQGNDHYLPVDFHSWRRAFCRANEKLADKKRHSNHATEGAFDRYVNDPGQALELPPEAWPKTPLLLHDPSLTTSAESNDDPDDDPTPPGGPRGLFALGQSSVPIYDSRTNDSASAELVAENTHRGVPQPGRGPALGASSDFQKADDCGSQNLEDLRRSDELGRTPTDFRTIEIERLSSGASPETSGNLGVNESSGQLVLNDCLNDSISVDPEDQAGKMTVVKGGADAMEGGVLILTQLMTEALERGDWETAEQLTAQLQRVIAVRTNARKKMRQL